MSDKAKEQPLFTREQLIKDEHFFDYSDVICAVMPKEEMWSVEMLDEKITEFLCRKTN